MTVLFHGSVWIGLYVYKPKNRSCLYVQCIKRGSDRAASQLNPVT